MKSSPNNSMLDSFISKTLKTPETDLPSVDWSEVDVLLQHEQKFISIPKLNPKYILMGAGALLLVIGIFFLVKFIGSSGSSSEEQTITSDTASVLLTAPDADVTTTGVPSSFSDSDKTIDTAHQLTHIVPANTSTAIPLQSPDTQKTASKEPVRTEKKKSKLSSLAPTISDTDYVPSTLFPADTAGSRKPEEIKNNLSPSPADTNKISSPKKIGKYKKGKTQNAAGDTARISKPDSLK